MSHEELLAAAPVLAPAIADGIEDASHFAMRGTLVKVLELFRGAGPQVWETAAAALRDASPYVRAEALAVLGFLAEDSEGAAARLVPHVKVGLSDSAWRVREAAAMVTAGEVLQPKQVAGLVADLRHALTADPGKLEREDPEQVTATRSALVAALARAGEKAAPAREDLAEALEDRAESVRAGAARALGAIGEAAREAEGALAVALEDDVPEVRLAAAAALARIGARDPKTARALGKLMRDESPEIALAATEAVVRMGENAAKALGDLTRVLKHDDPRIRAAAARGLGEIGPAAKRAARDLEKLAEKDAVEAVREAARDALGRIREE